jgi:hypothetical protein
MMHILSSDHLCPAIRNIVIRHTDSVCVHIEEILRRKIREEMGVKQKTVRRELTYNGNAKEKWPLRLSSYLIHDGHGGEGHQVLQRVAHQLQ